MDPNQAGTTGAGQDGERPAEATAPQAEPVRAEPQVNWDADDNPWKAKYHGVDGNFKQVKKELDEIKAWKAQAEADKARQQTEDADRAEEDQLNQLEKLVAEGDEEELRKKLLQTVTRAKAERQVRRQVAPDLQQKAYQAGTNAARMEYYEGLRETSEAYGLSWTDVEAMAGQARDFKSFFKSWQKAIQDKVLGPEREALKASLQEELKAQARASQPTPDASTGSPPSGDDDRKFLEDYAAGRSHDFKRAQKILSRLT